MHAGSLQLINYTICTTIFEPANDFLGSDSSLRENGCKSLWQMTSTSVSIYKNKEKYKKKIPRVWYLDLRCISPLLLSSWITDSCSLVNTH